MEKRLAREMDRTGLAEAEMATMRVKFATHLRRLQESTDDTEAAHLASKEDMQRQMQARATTSPLTLLNAGCLDASCFDMCRWQLPVSALAHRL